MKSNCPHPLRQIQLEDMSHLLTTGNNKRSDGEVEQFAQCRELTNSAQNK